MSLIFCHLRLRIHGFCHQQRSSADSSVIQLKAAAAVLAMSKSIMNELAHGHCGLSGDELAGHQAKLGAAETQPDNELELATRRTLIGGSCRPPPSQIQHERLKEVYTSLPDEQIETSFAKTERTDMARFRSGHQPALRCWQHSVEISEDAVCRLCGEEVESIEHIWLRCPALLVERHHGDLGQTMVEHNRLPRAALALLCILLRHMR